LTHPTADTGGNDFPLESALPVRFFKRLNQVLDRLDGLLTVHDDMVIYGIGDTQEEATADHNAKLLTFLRRCREKGIKLNKKKLKLLCKEIP